MTGGYQEKTEAWVKARQVRYPYADDLAFELAGPFNVFDLPFAVLVDPGGIVVWHGPPSALTEEIIRRALDGALRVAPPDWPAEAKDVREALVRGDLSGALTRARDLASRQPERKDVADAVDQIIEARVRAMAMAFQSGDYLAATELATAIEPAVTGTPRAERLQTVRDAMGASTTIAELIAAQRSVRVALLHRLATKADGAAMIAELEGIARAHPATVVEREVVARVPYIRRVMEGLP